MYIAYLDKLREKQRRECEHQPIQLEIPVPIYVPPEPSPEDDPEEEPSHVIVIQL